MMNKKVVGIAYINNGRLLVSMSQKSSKLGMYTLIGGGVEPGETIEEAAIRESKEELNFELQLSDLKLILSFSEKSASDPNLTIDMNMYIYLKEFNHELVTNEEIIKFKWYDISEDSSHLSRSIRDHLLPYAIEKGLLYTKK